MPLATAPYERAIDDTDDPLFEARRLVVLALAEIGAAGGPKTEAEALFVVSARVMLSELASVARVDTKGPAVGRLQ